MRKLSGKLFALTLISIILAATLLLGCAPKPQYPEDFDRSSEATSKNDNPRETEAEYALDVNGRPIEIHRHNSSFFWAFEARNYRTGLTKEDINAVIAKLTEEGYEIGPIQFHPPDVTYPSIMFLYMAGSSDSVSSQGMEEVIAVATMLQGVLDE